MPDHSANTTLLHAILKNQHSIADAVTVLVDWVERTHTDSSCDMISKVRTSLQNIEESRAVIGTCLSKLMRDEKST